MDEKAAGQQGHTAVMGQAAPPRQLEHNSQGPLGMASSTGAAVDNAHRRRTTRESKNPPTQSHRRARAWRSR